MDLADQFDLGNFRGEDPLRRFAELLESLPAYDSIEITESDAVQGGAQALLLNQGRPVMVLHIPAAHYSIPRYVNCLCDILWSHGRAMGRDVTVRAGGWEEPVQLPLKGLDLPIAVRDDSRLVAPTEQDYELFGLFSEMHRQLELPGTG